jgi:hypothetical protein
MKPSRKTKRLAKARCRRRMDLYLSYDLPRHLIAISRKELRRLREAAAYASFARPILEKLGDKNPLADI